MDVTYEQVEYGLAAGLLVLSMVGMGTTLVLADFWRVLRMPTGIGLVLLLQLVMGPTVAWCLAKALNVPPGIAFGMTLVTALPGGSYTNLMTYLGRGNVALSVTATTVCTLLCVLTAPLVIKTFAGARSSSDIEMPITRILLEILILLLVPLAAGMILKKRAPSRAALIGRASLRASLVLLTLIIVASLVTGRIQGEGVGWRATLAVVLLAMAMLWITYAICLACRQSLDDTYTIGIEVVVRNGNLGLLIKASLFPAGSAGSELANPVLFTVLSYAVISLIVAGIEVCARRRQVGLLFGRK